MRDSGIVNLTLYHKQEIAEPASAPKARGEMQCGNSHLSLPQGIQKRNCFMEAFYKIEGQMKNSLVTSPNNYLSCVLCEGSKGT